MNPGHGSTGIYLETDRSRSSTAGCGVRFITGKFVTYYVTNGVE
jgi:hypothetical protein